MLALDTNGYTLQWASKEMRENKDIVMRALDTAE